MAGGERRNLARKRHKYVSYTIMEQDRLGWDIFWLLGCTQAIGASFIAVIYFQVMPSSVERWKESFGMHQLTLCMNQNVTDGLHC